MKIILTVVVVIAGVLFRENIETFFSSFKVDEGSESIVFSKEELAAYNGIDNDRLYVAVIGSVFDVTEGSRNYAKGASYNYFVGKDGSRALITGNFRDESPLKDHILDMSCENLRAVLNWRDTFKNKYKPVGIVIGRYYDDIGRGTSYLEELNIKLEHCKLEKEIAKKEEIKFPPCNMSWDVAKGTIVWCTQTSGGVTRSWVGVPRQLFTPGEERPRCVCINLDANNSGALLSEYHNCPQTSRSCIIPNENLPKLSIEDGQAICVKPRALE